MPVWTPRHLTAADGDERCDLPELSWLVSAGLQLGRAPGSPARRPPPRTPWQVKPPDIYHLPY